MTLWTRLASLLSPPPAALQLPRTGEREAMADAAARMMEHEIHRRVGRITAMADANYYWQTGPVGNPNNGLLQSQDVLSGTTPQPYLFLTDYMLAQLFADPVTRRACGEIPASISRAGHVVSTPEGDDFLTDDGTINAAFTDAHTRANHLRAGGILIDVEEDGDPPLSEPLDPRKVRKIKGYVVFGGISMLVTSWQQKDEWVSPLFQQFARVGQPATFRLNATFRTGGYNGPVHWTRILYMQGVPIPPDVDGMIACPSSHYCLSVPDVIWTAVRRYVTTTTNAERLGGQQGAWYMTVPNKAALDASAKMGRQSDSPFAVVSNWVAQMMAGFYARKVMVGAPGFEINAATVNLSGWEQLEAGGYVQVANAARMPVQKLFMSLPAGLSATPSDQWTPQYDDVCGADFDRLWRLNLVRLYTLKYYLQTGRAPASITVRSGPWRQSTSQEEMALRKDGADELKTLLDARVITPIEARRRLHPTYTVNFPLDDAPPPAIADASAEAVWIGLEVDPSAMAPLWAALPLSVRRDPWPHLTLCYLGTVRSGALSGVLAAAAEHAARAPAFVTPIEVGPLGDEGTQVVFVKRGGIDALERSLFRAVAPAITAEQYPRFIPHVTIGYGEGAVNAVLPETLPIKALVVRQGEREIGRFAVA